MPRLSFKSLLSNWGPAIFMLACIGLESTDLMSSQHTHGWIYYLLQKYFPHVSAWQLWDVNLMIRKTGHVVGYGLLGAALYRAFRGTFDPSAATPKWTLQFATLAVVATCLVASADEIHQSFLPSRTGTWHDVVLDTSAAIVAQVIVWLYFRRRERKQADATPTAATARS